MSWWRKPRVNACHIAMSLLGMIGFNNINLTSLFHASFVVFFLPQTNSQEIVHSFLINGVKNTHQNKISDLVHKILDSLEKRRHEDEENLLLCASDCGINFDCETQKI